MVELSEVNSAKADDVFAVEMSDVGSSKIADSVATSVVEGSGENSVDANEVSFVTSVPSPTTLLT